MGALRWARRSVGFAVALALAAGASACRAGPEPVRLGLEECAYCRMVIEEAGFAAQALSARGKAYKFDSVECLAGFRLAGGAGEEEIASLWVADFSRPDRWLPAEQATYLYDPAVRSPMGLGLSAHQSPKAASAAAGDGEGRVISWEEVLALVGEAWGGGEPRPSHVAHGAANGSAAGGVELAAPAPQADIVVDPAGAVPTIAEALARARDGDRIRIRPGIYRETGLEVDRPVSLVGEGWPTVDGGERGTILRVTADGVEIRGLHLTGTGSSHLHDYAAVEVDGARDCVIADNRLSENLFGIFLARTRGCAVTGNRIRGHGGRETAAGNGVHVWYSSDARIAGNRIREHRDGIYLEFAERTVVAENGAEDNHRYGLHFMFSDGSDVRGNIFRRNGAGVAVMYTRGVAMRENTFRENWGPAAYGLLLKEITDSEIAGNRFLRNTVALYSEGSDRVEVRRNRFEGNGWAVKVMANSQENRFVENDFVENAFEVATNSRRNPNRFHGNYWSAYRGHDLAGDGVGDVPHRPVRLFSLVVERNPVALILLRSPFVGLLDVAERVLPVLTPETLVDEAPRMREWTR